MVLNVKNNPMKQCLLIFFLIILVSCQQIQSDSVEQNSFQAISVKEYYPEAWEIAQTWSGDALLFRIDAIVSLPKSQLKPRKEIDYIFESPTNINEYLVVRCNITKCNSKTYDLIASFISFGIDPISIENIKIDTFEATQIATINGCDKYLNSNDAYGRMTLGRDLDGTIRWLAYFSDSELGAVNILIDPFNGEVLEMDD